MEGVSEVLVNHDGGSREDWLTKSGEARQDG